MGQNIVIFNIRYKLKSGHTEITTERLKLELRQISTYGKTSIRYRMKVTAIQLVFKFGSYRPYL